MRKLADYEHEYLGHWSPGAVCRVEVYEENEGQPVIVLTELDRNKNTSVTNRIEYLAYDVFFRHAPHVLLGNPEGAVLIEHYPEIKGIRPETWDLVTFDSYKPRREYRRGVGEIFKLGRVEWKHIPPEQAKLLLDIKEEE
jgi:hypothetical protein